MAAAQSEWPAGGGEMGERIRAFDWDSSRLGPISAWPRSLRSAVDMILASGLPIDCKAEDGFGLVAGDCALRGLSSLSGRPPLEDQPLARAPSMGACATPWL
jgi:hypothetical protein